MFLSSFCHQCQTTQRKSLVVRATLTGFESLEPTTSAPSLVDWKCVMLSNLENMPIFWGVKRSCEFLRS